MPRLIELDTPSSLSPSDVLRYFGVGNLPRGKHSEIPKACSVVEPKINTQIIAVMYAVHVNLS